MSLGGNNVAEQEDDSGRFTSRIPKELRHDPDIQSKLHELDHASNTYLKFDMNSFQNEMNRELESHIGRLNQDYKHHQAVMSAKLDKCENANQKSWGIKEQMIDWRQQKLYAIQEVTH